MQTLQTVHYHCKVLQKLHGPTQHVLQTHNPPTSHLQRDLGNGPDMIWIADTVETGPTTRMMTFKIGLSSLQHQVQQPILQSRHALPRHCIGETSP
jgi:hypothetical protein